ncbi:transmembrane protein 9B-like isoform X3 [Stylophora pistillata]|uniref:transmembrane protein 9B-like isoform X3 n=1 Tax=Stylophora pistillata TaxID=50429 RepID=UPI000C050F02|nr:transmembrane protein 9B-like isoform X3 [Stylophora pistillata]
MILSNGCYIVAFLIVICEAQYDDVRCKCVCPKDINKTKNVFVKTVEPEDCKCGNIVQGDEKYCLRCRCEYEARNTTLIKGAKTFAAVMGKVTMYLMAILHHTKASPWLLVKTAITMAAGKMKKTKMVFCPPF